MRSAGVLLPIASLPSQYGIGTLGPTAYDFVDFLSEAHQRYWQILPIGPTGFGDSPYQSFSAYAGNPYFIDLGILTKAGLLTAGDVSGNWFSKPNEIDYALMFKRRIAVLSRASSRFSPTEDYHRFCCTNSFWLNDYALFMAIKESLNHVGLADWPNPLRIRDKKYLAHASEQMHDRVETYKRIQFFFFSQWNALKHYAHTKNVRIIGDIPIYVSGDSSDLWTHPGLFQLDKAQKPEYVAGCPPDAFNEEGQLWGNPLYNWKSMRRKRYAWWIERLRHAECLFDVTRIDHFRGFSGYYAIPADETTAVNGVWRKGPGISFVRKIHRTLPNMQIIAEDLGFLDDDVKRLLKYSRYPGMKILQFAFDSREESDYLPHRYVTNSVVYTGTHDNATTKSWINEVPSEDIECALSYLDCNEDKLTDSIIKAAYSSVSYVAIIPIQDWLGLGDEARINKPGTLGNNWKWRLVPSQLTNDLCTRMRRYVEIWHRNL